MALIACPECAADISDRAPTCPRCGVPVAVESKVVVSAPTQTFLVTPKVRVALDGVEVAVLGKGGLATIPIERDGVLSFSASLRSASVPVRVGEVTRVQLAWNRISGALVAQVVESITSGSSML